MFYGAILRARDSLILISLLKEWELDTDLSKQNSEQREEDTIKAKLDDKIMNKTFLHVTFVFAHLPCELDTPETRGAFNPNKSR